MIKNKIEKIENTTVDLNNKQMKAITTVDTTLLCGVLDFSGKKYFVDFEGFNKFTRFDKKFAFVNEDDKYPSYLHNYKHFTLLEFLFQYNSSNITYTFKNNNEYDLRRSNVEIFHKYHAELQKKYTVIEYIQGHFGTLGNDAYVLKNPLWKIRDEHNKEQLLMYCEPNILCILCDESYRKILYFERLHNNGKKLTFFKHQSGYICCTLNLYIHQIITGCNGNGKGTKEISVVHIDQNPLNNSMDNLRIATRTEQEQNSKGIKEGTKRARKQNAKPLPAGIIQDMMRKYVVYYDEYIDKEKTKQRCFFKIERHPKLDKPWMSSKSNKISLLEKLATANEVVDDLENNIYPDSTDVEELPKHITIKEERNKPHLIFDKKCDDGKRLNLRMVLPDDYVLEEQLILFTKKIKSKYDIDIQ